MQSSNISFPNSIGPSLNVGNFARFIPEPRNTLGNTFGTILRAAGSAYQQAASITGLDPTLQDLLNKQIEVQQQMQLVTMYSNIEKSKHETQMSAVRNIRVG